MGNGLLQRGQRRQRREAPPKTVQYKQFKGVNQTDSRVAIEDPEFSWLENAITVGNGAIQLLNGPGASIATFTQGVARHFGLTLNGAPIFVVVGNNGSLTQLTPGGVQTEIAGANAVTSSAVIAVWRGTTVLILDPTTGYASWDGTTYAVISAARKGTTLAVFQGRAWLVNGRTITFTSPNTFDDFNPANGSGSTIITDEAFPGNVRVAVSALEQLWLVGDGAVEAIANVVTTAGPPVTTTFSITNLVTNLGSSAHFSVLGYFRALAFLAPFGAYALAGVTPQKISEKLDGLFPFLIVDDTVSAAVAVVQNLLCLIFNVTYTGQQAQAGAGPRPLQLIFQGGKWSFASQGAVTWITDILVGGVAQAWATDGTTIFRLFGADPSANVTYKIQGKLSDYGQSTKLKEVLKTGLEFQSSYAINPTMLIENETADTESANLQPVNDLTWINAASQVVQWVNAAGDPIQWVSQGMVLSRQVSQMYGRYIGWTLSGTHPVCLFQAIQLQIKDGPDWVTPGPMNPLAPGAKLG